jgi:isoleucyl-tRNA synthetase
VLEPDEVLVERVGREGWAVAVADGLTVALDTTLDDDLRRLGRLNELNHRVNQMRRDAGLEITDRIRLWIPDEDLLVFADRIEQETLAVSVVLGPELRLEKA